MNTAAKKFTFDTQFAGGESRMDDTAKARQKRILTVEELDSLTALARHEGENHASVQAAQALERSVAVVADQLRGLLDITHAEIETVRAEAAALALAMARKIAPAALEALPAGDVEMALRQAMHQAIAEPRITLRAAPVVIEALKDQIEAIAQEEGYDGRVMLSPDATISGADCRIEWRGGGAERSEAVIEQALTALIAGRFSQTSSSSVPSSSVPSSSVKG